jgi:murein DD-endopeptidase MepM/ murein hydrolase activator NlpD
MFTQRQNGFSRVAVRLMLAAGAAALMAGCSDSSRLSDPFSDPFSSGSAPKIARSGVDRAPTGSIGTPTDAGAGAGAPSPLPGRVESRPLPGTTAPVASAQPVAPRAPAPVASAPAGGSGASHWTADGGTPVTVGSGETAAVLATRYGVPTDALLHANGYSNVAQVQPGARLIIPVYRAGAAAAAAAPAKAAEVKPVARPEPKAAEADPKAQKADALAKEQEAKRLKKAEADKAAQDARLAAATKAADAKKLAEAKQAEAKKAAEAKAAEAKLAAEKAKLAKVEAAKSKADATAKAEAQKAAKEAKLAQAEAAKAAQAEKQAKAEEAAAAKAEKQSKVAMAEKPAEAPRPAEKAAAPAPAAPAAEDTTKVSVEADKFRWPARGRIIQGFSSGGNDGINIAVPEGTPVKAAEDGQVAYAGSELKGYGNLVLIRHSNGFVTAYAHNGELDVKRGDTVKRGQTIAKSGQTGNVGSPQLHFELRKGATPVDPTNYLAGL